MQSSPAADQYKHSHADRPVPKALLPFVADREPNGCLVLKYEVARADGQMVPYMFFVGDERQPHTAVPLGIAVWQLMQTCFELQAQVDPLLKERDDLLTRVATLQGELEAEKSRLEGMTGKLIQVEHELKKKRKE